MIHVRRAREPQGVDAQVRQPGVRAIAELIGKRTSRKAGQPFEKIARREQDIPPARFPTYWTRAHDDLMRLYHGICAYSCFRIHAVTGASSADHFAPKSRRWDTVYEWSNYRLACSRLNARKKEYDDVLDPFLVRTGWFQLELLGFQVVPAPGIRRGNDVQATIDRLRLNDFCRDREKDATRYWNHDYSLRTLKEESPFVAEELRRQGRLNPGDHW